MHQALLPPPRRVTLAPGRWRPTRLVGIHGAGFSDGARIPEDSPAFGWLRAALAARGAELQLAAATPAAGIRVRLQADLGAQAYQLRVAPDGVELCAGDSAGAQHGIATLCQWIGSSGPEPLALRAVFIEDAPALAERGVLLDVARSKRPTLDVLKALIDRLASWKINRVQLYMEADFAYAEAHEVLEGRSPYTAAELRELDRFAAERHVQLVPNQQSFGHLQAWLRHKRFRHLAEVPEGVQHPFSRDQEPFSLNASDPRALEFVAGLYDQLLPCFTSDTCNVGLDETFDLGWGASRAACEARGKSRVYLDYLQRVHALLEARGKRMQYWGDIVLENPQWIGELPPTASAMVWGYEADTAFDEQLPHFAAAGLPFHVCPGTSSWNSLGGRVANALGNLRGAALAAQAAGAEGLLICDWGDRGHLQPWPIAFFGWVVGAACAWNPGAGAQLSMARVQRWLDLWAFEDEAEVMGAALIRLGQTSDVLQGQCENGNALFYHLVFADSPFPDERIGSFDPGRLPAARALFADALSDLPRARCARPDAALLARELGFARDSLLFSADLLEERLHNTRAGNWRELPATSLASLRTRLEHLKDTHRSLWSGRFRPGGLRESLAWLDILKSE